ncbi:hypothetical protein [Clostridium botulinum]|uniref:hypothetical protein n=1 Tax=Clostridium botulinum TaxID=1491 RepID=UPI00094770B3|nr:hypothetical protein [Clostridium botulinum]APQ97628.1 hypothetical protein RSJ3_1767 [Clostridium botulinum]MBN3361470.1 hypothetical protein [Clostridium botulinum]
MIKIDDSVTRAIKEDYVKAAKIIIKESIEKFEYNSLNQSYSLKDKKGNIICGFNNSYKEFIENFLGIKIERDEESVILTFNDNGKKIESIILGDLNKTIDYFVELFKREYSFEIKSVLKVNYNMKQVVSKIDKSTINKTKDEIKKRRKIGIDEFINLYEEFIDDGFLAKYEIKGKNGFSKIITNKEEFKKSFKLKNTYIEKIKDYKKKNKILKYIFDYDRLCNGVKIENDVLLDRHELISRMGFRTCPYCNRQYITNYGDKNKKDKTTADLDHFYSKSEYPFLALSLYNFIPSCQICNSRFKIADDFYYKRHVYPYKEEFGEDAKFQTSFYTEEAIKDKNKIYDIRYLLGDSDNFKIEIKPKNPKSEIGTKIQNSIETFHLQDLYNLHKDYVREIIKKAIIYNESRIDELYTQYPELFSSREEVMQMVVSNYISDDALGKRPLSKLTKDICEELGLR